jgi:hypothetical protein
MDSITSKETDILNSDKEGVRKTNVESGSITEKMDGYENISESTNEIDKTEISIIEFTKDLEEKDQSEIDNETLSNKQVNIANVERRETSRNRIKKSEKFPFLVPILNLIVYLITVTMYYLFPNLSPFMVLILILYPILIFILLLKC